MTAAPSALVKTLLRKCREESGTTTVDLLTAAFLTAIAEGGGAQLSSGSVNGQSFARGLIGAYSQKEIIDACDECIAIWAEIGTDDDALDLLLNRRPIRTAVASF